jgi:hypothetical protein
MLSGQQPPSRDLIGFAFDGVKQLVYLPRAKALAYIKEMHRMLCRKTVSLKQLQMLVGKLRHVPIILPVAKGFFSPINNAMQGSPKLVGLGANSKLRKVLEDLISILWLLSLRPTHVQELVPAMSHFAGYHDAAAEGAEGVWLSLCDNKPPMIWCKEFPTDIAADVVSENTPHSHLTNLDLELAVEVLAVGVALDRINNRKHTPLGKLCNNTPTVSWIDKLASKATSPTAGCLLRGLTFMLYHSHAGRLTTVHVRGMENVMADIASRPSKAQNLFHSTHAFTDLDFCSLFDTMFPLPGNQLLTLVVISQWLKFNVCKTMRGK